MIEINVSAAQLLGTLRHPFGRHSLFGGEDMLEFQVSANQLLEMLRWFY